jgi:membrane protein DedA with SNARE-associated domain
MGLFSSLTQTVGSFGYGGIFLLMALGSALIPIPSELVLPFGGYLAYQGRLDLWQVILWGTLGTMVGAQLTYELGRAKGKAWLLRVGRYILLSENDLDRATAWFDRFERPVIFFSRFVPGVRAYISFPAGAAKVGRTTFFVYSLAGSFGWTALLTYLGYWLGPKWDSAQGYFRGLDVVVALVLIGALFWYIRRHRKGAK